MSFDRVAHVYDATRFIPDGARERITNRLLEAVDARPDTRMLELGAGTGRIGLPLAARGARYTGIDIAPAMLDRFRAALPEDADVTLIEGDIMDLPFPDGEFDVVIAVHVFHLVPDWRRALDEALRVLRPAGTLALGVDKGEPGSPALDIRLRWRALLAERGVQMRPAHWALEAVIDEMAARGGYLAEYRAAEWDRVFSPLELMEALRDRVYSMAWEASDEVLRAVHDDLVAWGREQYGDLATPLPSRYAFDWTVSRIPSPGA